MSFFDIFRDAPKPVAVAPKVLTKEEEAIRTLEVSPSYYCLKHLVKKVHKERVVGTYCPVCEDEYQQIVRKYREEAEAKEQAAIEYLKQLRAERESANAT